MWGGARGPVGARRRAELKRCGSAAARFQAIRGLGYRALRVGLMCGITYVYLQRALPQRVINEAPATFREASLTSVLGWGRGIISLGKLRWALGEVVWAGPSCHRRNRHAG